MAPPDSAPVTTVAPLDKKIFTLELDDMLFESELDDSTPVKDDVVASGLPVGAAESEPVKKKVRMDFGFGAQWWGNQLGGNPVWTMHSSSTSIQRTWKGGSMRLCFWRTNIPHRCMEAHCHQMSCT
jgi:hypothetical protein